jgi:hypothetical protein
MSVRIAPLIAAAALAAACSSSNKETQTTATAQGTPVQESPASGSATDIASGSPAGTADTTTSTRGAIEGPAPKGSTMEGMAARGSPGDRSSARGKVANVDPNAGSITLDRDTDPAITVVVDQNTRFVGPDGRAMSQGMAAVHEGQQVRATMDPTSHRAEEIQITRDTGP